MFSQLSRNWWMVVLRGVLAILFGVMAFVWPGLTLEVLVIFFGAYAIIDGIFAIVAAFTNRTGHQTWWVLLLEGLVGIAAGLIAFFRPGLATVVLISIIAFWAILTGILEIVAAIRLRKEIDGEWKLALTGVLSLVFGVALLILPGAGALAITWMIGFYSIFFGVILLMLGWSLRTSDAPHHHGGMAPTRP